MTQLVKTQTRVNLSQEHHLSRIRKKLKTLGLRRLTLKRQNRNSSIFIITVEQLDILDQIAKMVNHSKEQQHDLVGRSESASILFYSSWRSSQIPHVSFKLERFQFFPLTASSRVHSKERLFQGEEGKRAQSDSITFSLSPSYFCFAMLVCVALLF